MAYNKHINTFRDKAERLIYLVHEGAESPNFAYCKDGGLKKELEDLSVEIDPSWSMYGITTSETELPSKNSAIRIVQDLGDGLYLYAASGLTTTHVLSGCTSIITASIGSGVTSISENTFQNCTSLVSVKIPDSVTSIGSQAFYGCTSLVSVKIPDGVTYLGINAFYGCTSLVSVKIPDRVTYLGSGVFYGCTSLVSVNIPDGVRYIYSNTFRDCKSLKDIKIPDGVTSIDSYTFQNCTSLVSVKIPDSVTSIGSQAFYGCTSLVSVKIPDSVKSIGDYAFYTKSAPRRMVIGSGITTIGFGAIGYATNFIVIVYAFKSITPPTIGTGNFNSLTETIYVPDESVDAYKAATNWTAHASKIRPLSQLKADHPDFDLL